MSKKTKQEECFENINELLGYYAKTTKGETMAAQIGFMMGWMSRLAATDWIIREELEFRLDQARKNSSSKDTSLPRRPLP